MLRKDFSNAVLSFYQPLKNFAFKLTKNTNDAEDLLHDTVLRAFRYKDKFVKNINLKSWLMVMMRNIFISNYRKKKYRKTELIDVSSYAYIFEIKQNERNEAIYNLTLNDIQTAIEKMPQKYHSMIMMFCMGFAYQDIAEVNDLPLSTVKSRLYAARKLLRSELEVYRQAA